MTRLMLAVCVATAQGTLAAQTVVPVHEEPRHQLVHEQPAFRILDVQIPPGDTTLFHRHDAPIAYVALSPSPVNAQVHGGTWGNATTDSPRRAVGRVTWNESYFDSPVTHRVTTVGGELFRLIAVLNSGPGDPTTEEQVLGSAGPAESEGRWFRSTHRTIEAGATLEWAPHDRPVIAVQVSNGILSVEPRVDEAEEIRGLGAFVVLRSGHEFKLRNRGPDSTTLAFVEVR